MVQTTHSHSLSKQTFRDTSCDMRRLELLVTCADSRFLWHAQTRASCDMRTRASCDMRTRASCDMRTRASCGRFLRFRLLCQLIKLPRSSRYFLLSLNDWHSCCCDSIVISMQLIVPHREPIMWQQRILANRNPSAISPGNGGLVVSATARNAIVSMRPRPPLFLVRQ